MVLIKGCSLVILFSLILQNTHIMAQEKTIDQKVDSLLTLMTLEEKVGQSRNSAFR